MAIASYDAGQQANNFSYVSSLLSELQSKLNNLRTDFLGHNHSNIDSPGTYVAKIWVNSGGVATTVASNGGTQTPITSASVATLPSVPLVGDNWLHL